MKLNQIVSSNAPITCVTKAGNQTILCRSDGSITRSAQIDSKTIFPFELIAIAPMANDRLVGLDKDGSVRFLNASDTIELIKSIPPDPAIRSILNQAAPGTGAAEFDYNGDLVNFRENIFFFRFDRKVVRMANDQSYFTKRWFSPLMMLDAEKSVPVLQPENFLVAGISSNSNSLFTILFPSSPPQTVSDMLMHLTRSTSSCRILDSIEIPNMVLETFAKLASSESHVFIQTKDCSVRIIELADGGMRLHSYVSVPVGGAPAIPPPAVKRLNSLPPLPVMESAAPLFPRYNPQLSVLRKHSQPVAYSSISETLLNLSLAIPEKNSPLPTGNLLTVADSPPGFFRSIFLPGEILTATQDGLVFVLTLDQPPFGFSRLVSPDSWLCDWVSVEAVTGVLRLPGNFSCVMKSNSLDFIVPSSVQCNVDLVIQLAGGAKYNRLSFESDLCLESVWERRSLAIIPGSHSVVSFDGEEDTSPRAKQRTSGFSVVDAGVVVCEEIVNFTDFTCEYCLENGMKLYGTFDGEVSLARDERTISQIPVSHFFSIECVVGDLPKNRILVGDRGGSLFELILDEAASDECLWLHRKHDIGVMPVKIQKLERMCLIHSGDRVWVSLLDKLELKEIHLGYPKLLRSVIGMADDRENSLCMFALTDDGQHVLRVTIDTETSVAEFSAKLPFEDASSVTVDKDHLFIVGTIPRMNQRALLEVELKHRLIGALESPETISLSSVLPFDSLKEDPMCVGIWHRGEYGNSLVVVGTHGKTRGRIIIFDRSSMTPLCKTSVPSRQVSAVEPLSNNALAVGCSECVVVVGLTTVDDQITLVTLGVYQTYTLVRHVHRVTDNRFLIVQNNGVVAFLELKGDTVIQIGSLESQRNIASPCLVLPNDTFICSSIEGDLLEFTIADVDTRGVMVLKSRQRIGSSIEHFHHAEDGALVGMSNASIFQISN